MALVLNAALLLAMRLHDADYFRHWLEADLEELGLTTLESLFLNHLSGTYR